ncbi:MAG: 1-hydroxycarotenoid 3,4-desaturase CrtD [Pseudomonadota bacterium]
MTSSPRVAVIGAGAGGLSAAALLARDFDVSVFERAGAPGGKIRQINVSGGLIDAGPTVFTMRWVFDEIFEATGKAFSDSVRLTKLDVIARHFWRDGAQLDLYADEMRSADAIGDFSGAEDARNYLAFCERTRRIYETLRDPFMRAPKPGFASLMRQRNPFALLRVNPFQSLWGALAKQFREPRLRQLFGRYATYCGCSPFAAPATLMLIAHVEQDGVWIAEGGMQAVANALAGAASAHGARFRYGTHVEKILTHGDKVAGVALANGETVEADIVVFNGDPGAVADGLLGAEAHGAAYLHRDGALSQSAVTWTMRAKRAGLDLSVHNVFFSDDYEAEFDAVFKDRRAPDIPTTYIFAPDRLSDNARGDTERLFCLINAPPVVETVAYGERELKQCHENMSQHLKTCGLTLKPKPGTVTATSPADFAVMFPGSRGALYGMANHGWRASFQRPGVKTRLKGLYLAGGGVHPGPGVPMAALSGKAAAEAIKADCASM